MCSAWNDDATTSKTTTGVANSKVKYDTKHQVKTR